MWGGCAAAVLLDDAPLMAAPLARLLDTDACDLLHPHAASRSGFSGLDPKQEGAAVLECRVSLTDVLEMGPGVYCFTAAVHCLTAVGGGEAALREAAARTVKFVVPAW